MEGESPVGAQQAMALINKETGKPLVVFVGYSRSIRVIC